MTVLIFTTTVFLISILAGLVGALTGLGGGVVLIPALVLFFKVNMYYAIGASLIAVIATSSAGSIAYLRQGYANIRIGMFLEVGAMVGALLGATWVVYVPTAWLAILFALVLVYSSYFTAKRREQSKTSTQINHPWADYLKLDGSYPTDEGVQHYTVQRVPLAFTIMVFAGGLAGLLGIGAGSLKVLAMDQAMGLPYKVSTTTSNFIIGITACVSAGIYFSHGFILPELVLPVILGVLVGAYSGTKLLPHIATARLRILFGAMLLLIACDLFYQGWHGL